MTVKGWKKRSFLTTLFSLGTVSLAAVSLSYGAKYVVTPLISPAPQYSTGKSINSKGSVTGWATTDMARAFVYRNHSTITLAAPDGVSYTSGLAINESGQVAGIAPVSGNQHAILWTNGIPQDLGVLSGAIGSYPRALNDLGAVVGYSGGNFGSYPFIWQNGVMSQLGSALMDPYSISNFGDVVGWSSERPVLLDSSGNMTYLSASNGYAYDINDAKQVVGRHASDGTVKGFLWQNGVLQTLPLPAGSTIAFPYAINSSGVMVGAGAFQNLDRAVLWENGLVYDLNTLIPSGTGWVLTRAWDINASGQIVGEGTYNGKTQGVILDPVGGTPVTQAAVSGTPGCGGWYISPVSVTLTATGSDIKEIHYTLDGATEVIIGDITATVPVSGDAAHTVRYYAVDYNGNVELPNNLAVNIDGSLPMSSASVSGLAGTNGWYKSPATVLINGTDVTSGVGSIKYRKSINGSWGSTVTGGNPASLGFGNFSSGGNGHYSVGYYAVDRACNAESEKFVDVNIDSTAPTSTHTPSILPGANGWYTGNVTATFTATDNLSGVSSITVNGAIVPGAIASYLLSAEGIQTLNYFATDFAGVVEASRSVTVSIDKTPPTTTSSASSSPNANGWLNGNVTATFTATDNLSGVSSVTVNGASVSGAIASYPLAEGTNLFNYFATDKAGLVEEIKSTIFRVDNTPPATSYSTSAPANINGWFNTGVTVNFSATDTLSGVDFLTINEANFAGSTASSVIGEGISTLTYMATDKAGVAEGLGTATFKVDKTVPAVTVSTSPATLVAANKAKLVPVTINGSSADSLSGVASVLITITDEYGSYNMTVPSFGAIVNLDTHKNTKDRDGRLYTVKATATDFAGNQQTSVYNLFVK